LCYGQVLPPPETTSMIEFSHRFVAGIGGLLILGTVIMAWRGYRRRPWIVGPATLMIVVLPLQFVLGAIVVYTELEPLTVAIHLGTALIIFAASIVLTLAANRPAGLARETYPPRYLTLLLVAVPLLFVLLTTGAVVVGEGASFACPDWPLCNGQLLPTGQTTFPALLQMIHRLAVVAAGAVGVWVAVVTLRGRAARPLAARWTLALIGLFLAQALIGAIQIWLHLPTVWRVLHLGVAAGVWAALIGLTTLVYFREKHVTA
jgi:cytochrome c oxidase assembly protein subunit 15